MKKVMTIILLLMVLFFHPSCILSQQQYTTKSRKAIDAYNSGLQNYSLYKYTEAEKLFNIAIKADPEFIEAYLLLAEVYEDSYQPLKAIDIYRKVLPMRESYYPNGYIRLANLEYKEGQYENSLVSYNRYLSFNTNNTSLIQKAKDGIARCEFSINAVKHPVDFKPVRLGSTVNTTGDEYWPSLSTDEKTLVITRLVPVDTIAIAHLVPGDDYMKKVQEDFFISHWNGENWDVMKNAGRPLNTADNEGAQTISGDGRYMIFTACNRKDGIGRCDLYSSNKEGDSWSTPVNLGKPINTIYRETQPSMTPDGRTLYFSSDRPGGKGLHDIWVSYRDDNNHWSTPENMGDKINTRGVEMSPFIHPDNQSLYFSSDGLIGLGGFDLFVSRRDSLGTWQKPVNLGYPINTNRDEIGLIVNSRGDKAYYSSDIDTANGKDIFVFDLPVQDRPLMVTYMKGKVFDARDKRLLRAQFELVDLETGSIIYRSFSDSVTGEFMVSIPVNHNYMLNVSRKAYLFFSENFSLKNNFNAGNPFLKDVPLQPLVVGNSVVLKNVFFETDSYKLRKESTIELNKVVRLLQANPGIKIEIGGHTDNVGSLEYNQKLSENRAKTVADYLIAAFVKANRIVSMGYGMNMPVATNATDEGRAQNRRTELKIIE
jgi:outer membrane protein OmpA-like peptidoglycan-associated protein